MIKKEVKNTCAECLSFRKGIFRDLKEQTLEEIADHKTTNSYAKGQILFEEGAFPAGLFCVSAGNIKLVKINASGKESLLRIVQGGDVLGYRSLFSRQNYQATAIALEESTVCFLNKNYLFKLIESEPSVAVNLIKKLSGTLGVSEEKLVALTNKNVQERVAAFLLLLNESHGIKNEDGHFIDLKLTREEMASGIGTATETLIRFISELREAKIIKNQGKNLVILDIERLEGIANISV